MGWRWGGKAVGADEDGRIGHGTGRNRLAPSECEGRTEQAERVDKERTSLQRQLPSRGFSRGLGGHGPAGRRETKRC